MGVFDELFADVAAPSLLGGLGEPVAHDGTDVPGIFDEQEPRRELGEGYDIVRMGVLQVDAALAVTLASAWTIRGQSWQTSDFDTAPAAGGLRNVYVQRKDKQVRNANRKGGLY